MELSYLGINNYSKIEPSVVKLKSEANTRECKNAVQILNKLGNNENMLTNIDHMRNRIASTIENGKLEEESYQYIHLISTVDEAIKLQTKPNKTFDDIINFYTICENFNDILGRVDR